MSEKTDDGTHHGDGTVYGGNPFLKYDSKGIRVNRSEVKPLVTNPDGTHHGDGTVYGGNPFKRYGPDGRQVNPRLKAENSIPVNPFKTPKNGV